MPGGLDRAQPHLALLVHLGFWLYAGGLHGRRRATWLLLVVGAFVVQVVLFLGHVLPWGQMGYWIAAQPGLGPLLRPLVEGSATRFGSALLALVLPTLLALDLWTAHRGPGWRRAVGPVLGLIVVGYVAFAGTVASACSEPEAFASVAELREQVECRARNDVTSGPPASGTAPLMTPAAIVPEWNVLPAYAVLRATPGKLGGVIAAFVFLLLPVLAVLFRAERLREGRAAPVWLAASLSFFAAYIALGWLGAQPAEEPFLLLSRALALYVFAFFLLPFALHRLR